ncbi:MAG: ribose 5-phosphate isomerase B [Alphaproteobacteria bacterium]|jgi:ribose 5-phosphate isomerase B
MPSDTVAIAADHAGVELKSLLRKEMEGMGLRVLDLGTDSEASVDYPDFGAAVARAITDGKASRGVVVCGTGLGIGIAANRFKGVRAAPCGDATAARLARQHNDANVLALGARLIGVEVAKDCLKIFLETPFDGGERHSRRIGKLG